MKRLLAAAAAAAAGAVALAALFPRLDPSATIRSTLDRARATARARELTLRYGVDAGGWNAAVWDQASEKQRAYLAAHPDDPAARLIAPLTITVVLREPGGSHRVRVVLFPDGRPAEWRMEAGPDAPEKSTGVPLSGVLHDFAGANLRSFGSPTTEEHEGVMHRKWEWAAHQPALLTASIDIDEKAGVLRSATLSAIYSDEFNREYSQSHRTTVAERAALWVRTLAWIPALILCVWQAIRRRFQYRIPVLLLSAQVAWAVASLWGSTYYQQLQDLWPSGKALNLNPGIANYGWSMWAAFAFVSLFLFAGAGRVMPVAGNAEKWLTLELVARGRIRNRAVGRSLATGLLGGIAIAAVPYVGAALFKGWLPFHSVDALVAPVTLVVAVRLSAMVLPLELFGFLFPLAGYLRRPLFRWACFLPVGLMVAATAAPPGVLPAFGTAVLLLAGYLAIYLRVDLLAAMTAAVGARFLVVPCVLLSQPSGSLRESGLLLFGLGAAALAASVHLALRAPQRESQYEGIATEIPYGPAESERERLEAEFAVARKAQQAALPDEPPIVQGYSLAAACEPAYQVGGDLYDFFPLPDGRLGITVADVSGKGVPAALYMMVTKGLLAAVSRDSAELPHILQQVNLHLYRACRRKVFVTMAAVALDAPRRRIEYGRAGHNPVVWRRAKRGETVLLKPRGLGLGMTPNEPFQRYLEIEEFELEPGDAVVLYSDGVTEAVNEAMQQYGERRLARQVEQADGQPAFATRDAILRDLAGFMGAAPARDDITVVVLRVDGNGFQAVDPSRPSASPE